MIKIEKNKEHKIHFMPNISNPNNSIKQLTITAKINPQHIAKMFFSYVLLDDKIDILRYGNIIKKYINKLARGFYGNSDGFFISDDYVDNYYSTSDKSDIITEKMYDKLFDNKKLTYNKHNDIVYYGPMNIFDVKCEYNIYIKTTSVEKYLHITHVGLSKCSPLYNDGDDKESIKKMWDNIITLDEEIQKYKLENDADMFFDDEANSKHYDEMKILRNS